MFYLWIWFSNHKCYQNYYYYFNSTIIRTTTLSKSAFLIFHLFTVKQLRGTYLIYIRGPWQVHHKHNHYNNPPKWTLASPFCKRGNWGSWRWGDLPKVQQPVSSRIRFKLASVRLHNTTEFKLWRIRVSSWLTSKWELNVLREPNSLPISRITELRSLSASPGGS